MQLSTREKHELLSKFFQMDSDGNGELNKAEIQQCLYDSQLPNNMVDVSIQVLFYTDTISFFL